MPYRPIRISSIVLLLASLLAGSATAQNAVSIRVTPELRPEGSNGLREARLLEGRNVPCDKWQRSSEVWPDST